MNELITQNEVMNDGRTIHLYFNGLIGLWAAYGFSAYLLSQQTTVSVSYSGGLQMPVVVLNAAHLKEVKNTLSDCSEKNGYVRFTVTHPLDETAYEDWADMVRRGII